MPKIYVDFVVSVSNGGKINNIYELGWQTDPGKHFQVGSLTG
jgi:hypothetical protein